MDKNKKPSPKNKAIIYTRVSSTKQTEGGTSLDSQKKICQDYCGKASLEVDKVFSENAAGAKITRRTELKKLLDYARKHKRKINYLVVYKWDRLARNMEDNLWIRKEFAAMGIAVKSATEAMDDSPAARLQEGLLAVFNEYDRDLRRERRMTAKNKIKKTNGKSKRTK